MNKTLEISPIRIRQVGRVQEVKKAIARVRDLSGFMNGQLVDFAGGTKGMIIGFGEGDILVLLLGDEAGVRAGEEVTSVQEEFRVPVGEKLLGRIVSALGEPCDDKGEIDPDDYYPVFREAPETMDREAANSCFESGTKIIDAIIPLSKGQRQLIIGDRMTGKTMIAVDAILNQKDKDVVCIYCCIGKSFSSLLKVVQILKQGEALDYTIIVASTASTTVGEQYLAPNSASAFGEYFMRRGRDVLIVFDDMTKHAWSYRQISLLLERPPGREAYPGDIYYVHSQLVERAGKLKKELGGGSMTFLPIVDTLQGDVTGFIPSNLISMMDGQIYLSSALFAEGFKPAIDLMTSTSIIGSITQNPILQSLAHSTRREYIKYRELLRLSKLKGALTDEAARTIYRGEVITAILTQDKNRPASIGELIVLLYAMDIGVLNDIDMANVKRFKDEIWEHISGNNPGLAAALQKSGKLTPKIKAAIDKILVEFFKREG